MILDMTDGQTLQERLRTLAGPDLSRTPVPDLATRLQRAPAFSRQRLCAELKPFGDEPAELEDESSRVAVARLLAALLPESRTIVQTVLEKQPASEPIGELQFALFVALSDIFPATHDSSAIEDLTSAVEEYLLRVASDSGQAAWMAGDLLGDHWPLASSLGPLENCAQRAQHEAGRLGAIHGLSRALTRATKPDQWRIVQTLRNVATADVSDWVRRSAELALGELRGV